MTGVLRFTPTAEQLTDAYQLHHRRVGTGRIVGFLLFALLLGIAVAAIEDFKSFGNSTIIVGVVMLWSVLILAIVHFGAIKLWLPRFARRVFRQQRDLHGEVTITWDAQAFRSETANGHGSCPWGDFHAWRRDEKSLLLYRSEAIFNFLPLNNVASRAAADTIVSHLCVAGVKVRS